MKAVLKKSIAVLTGFILALPGLVWLLPFNAFAQPNPQPTAAPSPAAGKTYTIPNPLGQDATIQVLLNRIIDFLLVIAGPLAVAAIVWAGIVFMTAGDNKDRLGSAKKILTWAVVGIVVLLVSKGIAVIIKNILTGA